MSTLPARMAGGSTSVRVQGSVWSSVGSKGYPGRVRGERVGIDDAGALGPCCARPWGQDAGGADACEPGDGQSESDDGEGDEGECREGLGQAALGEQGVGVEGAGEAPEGLA